MLYAFRPIREMENGHVNNVLLKIKWIDKIRNEEVYRRIDEERTLWNNIEKRRTRWIGHTLRHNGFMKNIIGGKIEGKGL
jgi:hypothetical protein